MKFKFVHAADLHLDSPMQGLLAQLAGDEHSARILRRATAAAFERLVDLCIANDARFLIISGDVYDGEECSLHAQLCLRKGLERLRQHQIKAFIAHGNHDPLETVSRAVGLPDNTHVFGSEAVDTVAVAGADGQPLAMISGISYRNKREGRALQKHFHPQTANGFKVAVLHCNVGSTGHVDYVPCELGDLVGRGYDYWALGHVHEHRILHETPHVVYPGCSQGRSIREYGARGCCVVTVDPGTECPARVEFVALDAVRWQMLELNLDGISTVEQLVDSAVAAVDERLAQCDGRSTICRIRLTGRTSLFGALQKKNALDDILEALRSSVQRDSAPFVWVESISLECGPAADLALCREADDLLGEVLRIAQEAGQDSPLRQRMKAALTPLFEHNRARRALEAPDDAEFDRWLESAALLCYDLLAEDKS